MTAPTVSNETPNALDSCPPWCVDHQDDTAPNNDNGARWHYGASTPWSDRPGFSVRLEQFETDDEPGPVELSIQAASVDGMREAIDAPVTSTEVRRLAEALLAIAETTA
jgi:hypothetical protein